MLVQAVPVTLDCRGSNPIGSGETNKRLEVTGVNQTADRGLDGEVCANADKALDRIGNEHRVAAGIGRVDIRDCVEVRRRSVEIGLATAARAAQSAAALKTCDFSSCTALENKETPGLSTFS